MGHPVLLVEGEQVGELAGTTPRTAVRARKALASRRARWFTR